jgi:hypothetical protein
MAALHELRMIFLPNCWTNFARAQELNVRLRLYAATLDYASVLAKFKVNPNDGNTQTNVSVYIKRTRECPAPARPESDRLFPGRGADLSNEWRTRQFEDHLAPRRG